MAGTEREERRGSRWISWLAGLVVLVLLIWWLWPAAETEEFATVDTAEQLAPADQPEGGPLTEAGATGIPAATILASPEDFFGQEMGGTVTVLEVAGPRAFWVQSQEARILVVADEAPLPGHVQAGRSVELRDAEVRDGTDLDAIAELDDTTLTLLRGQAVYLSLPTGNIRAAASPAGVDTGGA